MSNRADWYNVLLRLLIAVHGGDPCPLRKHCVVQFVSPGDVQDAPRAARAERVQSSFLSRLSSAQCTIRCRQVCTVYTDFVHVILYDLGAL